MRRVLNRLALLALGLCVGFGWATTIAAQSPHRMLVADGATREAERAIPLALNWLARHQMLDGRWSLDGFRSRCKDATCTGPGVGEPSKGDMGGTAMGLLPLLAAGQTHKSKGPYQANMQKGFDFLVAKQKADGDLRGGGTMYSHGFAALALCEAYALTQEKRLGAAAQKAIDFIQSAQHKPSGGWRYQPDTPGDTSVFGWQLAALRSAEMAGLKVSRPCLDGARKYLKSAQAGEDGAKFSYVPGTPSTLSMTAVGLLCSQRLGAGKDSPQITAGAKYLLEHLPDATGVGQRNAYYWYYATQVLHNVGGPDWDTWHRTLRRTLINTQAKEGCAAGSWDPGQPVPEAWGVPGGRLMETSLSTLALEVYYCYLHLD
jgi:hypothetical protein